MRKENGMTQAQLADKMMITDKAVSMWERGIGFPDINMLEPLAANLGHACERFWYYFFTYFSLS